MKNLFTWKLLCFIALLFTTTGAWTQQGPHAFFKFAEKPGCKFKILLFGAKEGSVTVDWGDGKTQSVAVSPDHNTLINGQTQSQQLNIWGDIAALDCSGNKLLEIDVTTLPNLQSLVSRKNFTRALDVRSNPLLTTLCVENSPLETIDLTHNTKLEMLLLDNNKLTQVTMPTTANQLTVLDCSFNHKLSSLDLTKSLNLTRLQLLQTSVTQLPLASHKQLRVLTAGLVRPITQIEFAPNNLIDTLFIPSAGLQSIDISQCVNLKSLVLDNNFMLSKLDVSHQPQLSILSCTGTMLTKLDVSHCKELKRLDCNNSSLEKLDLSQNTKLEALACFVNNLKELKVDMTQLENLDCSNNAELSLLQLPATLKDLNCSSCNLSELNIAKPEIMESLVCSENRLTSLDASHMSKLASLTCNKNNIKEINTSDLKELLNVNVSDNPITKFPLYASPKVSYVEINNTQLDVAALDDLYRSLRAIPQESQQTGIYYLANDVADAPLSSTSIASEKGWTVTVKGDGSGSGVDTVNAHTSATPTAYYTIDGRLHSTPQQGVNIMKMSDGTTRKIIVK